MASISNNFKSSATFLKKTYTKPVLLTGQLWSSFTLNVAARPINLGLYPWEEIAQVFMVSGTFGVLKTESKFYVTECHNLQQYHPINISIYLSKPSEFTRAELSLVSIPSLQTNCSILYCTQKGINSPNLLLLKRWIWMHSQWSHRNLLLCALPGQKVTVLGCKGHQFLNLSSSKLKWAHNHKKFLIRIIITNNWTALYKKMQQTNFKVKICAISPLASSDVELWTVFS